MALGALVAGAVLGGLFGRRRRRKQTPQQVFPQLVSPFLSPEEIQKSPILSQFMQYFQQAPQLAAAYASPEEMTPVIRYLQRTLAQPLDITQAVGTVQALMRPLFEEQLGRQLEITRAQLARTLGTPVGGALAEALRRQIQESERQFMSTMAQYGFEQLGRMQQMQQWAAQMLPTMITQRVGLATLPITLQASIANMLRGTFVAPQFVQPTYAPSTLEQLAGVLLPAAILGGGRIFG